MRSMLLAFVVGFVVLRSLPAADPASLIGMTEEQVVKKYGPENLKVGAEEEIMHTGKGKGKGKDKDKERGGWQTEFYAKVSIRRAPVETVKYYDMRKVPGNSLTFPYVMVGYDKDGQVCATSPLEHRHLIPEMVSSLRKLTSTKWAPEPSARQLFPPIENAEIGVGNQWIVWNDIPGGNISVGRRTTGPAYAGIARVTGILRAVSVTSDRKAYLLCDIPYDSKDGGYIMRTAQVVSADTFWQWTLADLIGQFDDLSRDEFRMHNDRAGRVHRMTYEEVYRDLVGGRGQAKYCERMAVAVTAIVRNPQVTLALADPAIDTLKLHGRPTLTKALTPILGSVAEPMPARDRAATVLGGLNDPDAVAPLIAALTTKPVVANAAKALEAITGQAFGKDAEAWGKWWQANERAVRKK